MSGKSCPVCDKPLGRNKHACSLACYAELRQNYKMCVICGKPFPDAKANDTVTCGEKCSTENRKRLHASGKYDGTMEKAHAVAATLPHTGPFETHMHAKEWVIQSPTGTVYRCRNLKLWLREHADLLDGTIQQAWDGITKIKYSMQGKRKNKSFQWKGWTLIEWGD